MKLEISLYTFFAGDGDGHIFRGPGKVMIFSGKVVNNSKFFFVDPVN